MPHAAHTSTHRLALGVAVAAWLSFAADGSAATSFSAGVLPARPAAGPVTVSIGAALSASARGGLPPTLRGLAVAMPPGFATALDETSPCARDDLELRGPAACPASAALGSGSASFVYVAGALRIGASTRELRVFRGAGDAILVYVRVTQPAPFAVVLPGTLAAQPAPAGPRLSLDLGGVARIEGGGSAVVTRIAVDLERGLAAGPCPWAFVAQLDYEDGGSEQRTASATCETGPDTTAPALHASARDGTTARGARVRLRLSEAATVRVTLERRTATRWVRVRRTTTAQPAGTSVLRVARGLRRGRYTARVRAVDAAGLESAKRTVAFRLR